MKTALEGIKVLELSIWVAGPTCGVLLAELGAKVVRVEPLEGDPVRGLVRSGSATVGDFNWIWEVWNRSKRGVALDLRTPEGRDIVHKLASESDIFLTNLRPDTLKRAHLDYATLRDINPRIIYANITGFGPRGPATDWPSGDEIAFWGRSGLASAWGDPDAPPFVPHAGVGDSVTGGFMLGGIALALYARERTGLGQKVDVSLLGAANWVNNLAVQGVVTYGKNAPRLPRKRAGNPLVNEYRAKCGRWAVFDMRQTDRFWAGLCKALGKPELEHDARFGSHEARLANNEELIALLDEIIATRTLAEWQSRFYENDLDWGPIQTMTDVMDDASVLENDYIVEYEHFSRGAMKGPGGPIQLSEMPPVPPRGAPEHGQHTEEVLLELGYGWDDIERLKQRRTIL
jgi:crotonobetainyl-CoA:carnitine CoA-transferase CaiB-like acyl-CoA transferase